LCPEEVLSSGLLLFSEASAMENWDQGIKLGHGCFSKKIKKYIPLMKQKPLPGCLSPRNFKV
jgi:hypothetical protein